MDEPAWWGAAFEHVSAVTPARIAVVRWHGDDGVVEWVNAAAAALMDVEPADVAGRAVSEVYPPRYAREIGEQFRLAAEHGSHAYEVVRELPGGRRTLQAINIALGDDRFVSFALDVTREREAERRLAEVTELTGAGLFHWNVPDHVTNWTDELYRLLGYAPGEVEASPELYLQHVHPEDRSPGEEAFAAARSGEGEVTVDRHRVVRRDGEVRTVDIRSHRINDGDGMVAYVSGIVRDVTDEVEFERHAELVRRAAEQQRTALTVHDKVVQALATVLLALDLGELDTARAEARSAVTAAQSVVADLLGDMAAVQGSVEPGTLRAPTVELS
jgi:PAS domain S-box-containing protein